MAVLRALNNVKGEQRLLDFLKAYWARMRLHFLVPSFPARSSAAVNARFDAAACLEISMKLQFPHAYAFSSFGDVCRAIAAAEGVPELYERLCLSVSKRVMVCINSRIPDALLKEK